VSADIAALLVEAHVNYKPIIAHGALGVLKIATFARADSHGAGKTGIIYGKFLQCRRMRLDERVPAEIPGTRPELRPRTAAAQTRIVSVARIRLGPRNLRGLSKG
jgi:hypothetical protein